MTEGFRARFLSPRPPSLSTRLTTWYFLSSLGIVLVVTGYLYSSLVTSMRVEDDRDIMNKVQLLTELLATPGTEEAIAHEVVNLVDTHRELYARILAVSGEVLFATAGMSSILPVDRFPDTAAAGNEAESITEFRSLDGRP